MFQWWLLFFERVVARDFRGRLRVVGASAFLLLAGPPFSSAWADLPSSTQVPTWISSSDLTSEDGDFQLAWTDSAGDSSNENSDDLKLFYKVTETFAGNPEFEIEAYTAEFFVEGVQLPMRRVVPGEYQFSLQACAKSSDGFPVCGSASEDWSLTVTDSVIDSMVTESEDVVAPVESAHASPTDIDAAPDGGPAEFRPGNWFNPDKTGHGWTFFWSNHLAYPVNDSAYGNSYDLVGVWYTYEAKLAVRSPHCDDCPPEPSFYRPLALRLNAVLTSANTYSGTVYKTQASGADIAVGSATLVFGADSLNASIEWAVSFKKESLSDTDNIAFLHGSNPDNTNEISHLSGLWEPINSNEFYLVSDIGSGAEVDDIVFHDNLGDPTWIQADYQGTPVIDSTFLCFGYLKEGYSPADSEPATWDPVWHMSGCDKGAPAIDSNHNASRNFLSNSSQTIWADFTLLETAYAQGTLSAGSIDSPVNLEKVANFHSVRYSHPFGSECDLAELESGCLVTLDWFTDSFYPSATVFAFNTTTGVKAPVQTSTQAAMLGVEFDVETAGVYEFELRMGDSPDSTLMAVSDQFSVTSSMVPPPGEGSPEIPPDPVGPPSMNVSSSHSKVGSTVGQFRVDDTGAATYAIPIMNAPASGGLQPHISLNYSSLADNGVMGVGWSLGGLSAITRCAQTIEQDGITGSRAVLINSTDRFCLDGSRLILIPGTGDYGSDGSQYRTEIDSFSRATLNGNPDDGSSWFKVEHKDGSQSTYGRSESSNIEARGAENPDATLFWLTNRQEDRFGNYMLYRYEKNTSGPIGYVVTRIDYSGNSRAGTQTSARLIFEYSDRDIDSDLTYTYSGGVQMEQLKLLESIRLKGKGDSASGLTDMRYYDLVYEQVGLGRQILTSLNECSSKGMAVCFPATRFDWLRNENGITGPGTQLDDLLPRQNVRGLVMADVNGDGRPDMLYTRKVDAKMLVTVLQANADGTFTIWPKTYETTRRQDGQAAPLLVMDADGDGLQDIAYSKFNSSSDDYAWVALISTGSDFTSERKLHPTFRYKLGEEDTAPIAQAVDFNGDGLGDVLFTQTGTEDRTSELTVMINHTKPSNDFGFSDPATLQAENYDLFALDNNDHYKIRYGYPLFTSPNVDGSDHKISAAQVFDFDNDGTADLLLRVSREYEVCVEGCYTPAGVSHPASDTAQPDSDSYFAGAAEDDDNTPVLGTQIASFWVVMTSNGSDAYTRHSVLAFGEICEVNPVCEIPEYGGFPSVKSMSPVDINADGLTDLVWRAVGDYWYFQINTGQGFTDPQDIARAPYDVGDLVRFEDWNGDGYPDLLYPSAMLDGNATWMVHYNHFGREFAGAENTGAIAGNVGGQPLVDNIENDSSIFADFTGDGKPDQLRIDRSSAGENLSTWLVKGSNLLAAGGDQDEVLPGNVITSITDGYGAVYSISYKPMTDPGVYTRMHDSGAAIWGRGSVVYDLAAPIYLVHEAKVSAPRGDDFDTTSSIFYHYIGAKMQAGGRGFLGFGEMVSFDPQNGIRTNTRFRQDFPFVGLIADKMEVIGSSTDFQQSLSNSTSNTIWEWGQVGVSSQVPAAAGGTPVSYKVNEWASVATIDDGAVFPFRARSLEVQFMLGGGFAGKTFTSSSFDDFGNILNATVSTYATETGASFSSQTTSNAYYPADVDLWRFGRVQASNVTKTRSGAGSITLKTEFEYVAATGSVRREIKEPGHPELQVTTVFTHDKFGNQLSSKVSGIGMAARTSSSAFDSFGRFAVQDTDALGQVTRTVNEWDRFGNALRVTKINGIETIGAADRMGRLVVSYTETGEWSKTTQTWGRGTYCPLGTTFNKVTTGGGKPTEIKCFDLLQRELRNAKQTLNGDYAFIDQRYDSSGRIIAVSEPYTSGDPKWSHTQFDVLGRITGIMSAAGDDVLHEYDMQAGNSCANAGAHQLLVTNGLGRQQLQIKNVLGESIEVYDASCGRISYAYDAQGNLTRITGADGAVTSMTYDLAGRKVAMSDPDKGNWYYAYNALGEMTRQLDNKSQAIDFVFDKLGRVKKRFELIDVSSPGDTAGIIVNTDVTQFISEGAGTGQVGATIYRDADNGLLQKRTYLYDSFGRQMSVSTKVGGNIYEERTTYDQFGRVFQQFDASGDDNGLRYYYSHGYLRKIREAREGVNGKAYQRIIATDARGNVTNMKLGNVVEVFADYDDASGRLLGISAYNNKGEEIQNIDYLFDVLGNLKHRYDYSSGANLREKYTYDELDRLRLVQLSVDDTQFATTLDTRYDAAGNITYKSDIGNYLYQAAQPHAVSRAGDSDYTYDANGNQTTGRDRTIEYTIFDKPSRITKGDAQVEFAYGSGNSRYQRKDYNGSTLLKTTEYLGTVERITKAEATFFKRYLAGVAIADYYPSTGAQTVSYLLKDHIGSIHTVLTDRGKIATTMHFGAFGQRQSSNWETPLTSHLYAPLNDITTKGFTGHEQIDEMDMIHMNGRTYDPMLGRFLQADPVVQSPKYSQSLNRYSYVMNNPLSFTDPTGYITFGDFWKKWGRTIMVSIVAAGVFYAAGGALVTIFKVPAETAWVAAVAGGISGAAGSAMMGGNRKAILKAAVMGAVTAYVGNRSRAGFNDWRKGKGKLYEITVDGNGIEVGRREIINTSSAQIDRLFVNGQSNDLSYAIQNGIRQMEGAKKFFLFHNPTSRGIADTVESALGKLTNRSSISNQLAEILSQNADTLQVITAHSQGTIIVSNAFRQLAQGTLSKAVTVNFNGAAVGRKLLERTADMAGVGARNYVANNFDFVTNVIGMGTANPIKIVGSILAFPLLFTQFSPHVYGAF